MAIDYCTVSDLKASLSLTGQSYADADFARAITTASRAIDQMAGRRFWKDDSAVTRKYVPRAADICATDDIAEFTSLTVQGSVWVADTDFFLEPPNASADGEPYTRIRSIGRPFLFTTADLTAGVPGFDGRISVLAKFGWPSVPPEIAEASRILASRLVRRIREASFGVVGAGFEGEVVRIAWSDPDVDALVSPYSRPWLV
jgi:hypothetical protein